VEGFKKTNTEYVFMCKSTQKLFIIIFYYMQTGLIGIRVIDDLGEIRIPNWYLQYIECLGEL